MISIRDHRKIGKELDLFCFSDLVGPGLPLFTPRGTIIKEELQKAVEKICKSYGFQKVFNPHLANIKLYEISGHAQKFSDEIFHVTSEKGHDFVLKPVLCPHHTQLFASKMRSYRDLPIRYMESEKQYRAELPGSVSGLSRVYAISIEDGHSFCRVDQVKEEVIRIVNIIRDFYSSLGLWDSKWVSLSVRDYSAPEKYIGDPKDWDICEDMLKEISDELSLDAKRCEGEAALYGPKLDFMFKDALGREVQIPTVQLDFATPKRFELFYTDSNGNKVSPVMVHRAILGSYERFMMLLIENYAGAFPLWLSPVQVNIVPVNIKNHLDYCVKLREIMMGEEIRAEIDDSSKQMNYKIRQSNMMKNPYTVIIGDRERDDNKVSYRLFGSTETVTMRALDFINKVKREIKEKIVKIER
ncbi:MAG: threonine--tRNA ligase [Oscillospiraceae bacterium]|nr:threonine--tRNA ligase [Oscillospiraceae bacterium]